MSTQPTGIENDYNFYQQHRSEWATQHPNEFVLVCKGIAAGFYNTYEDAYRAGLNKFGLNSEFLVKQVSAVEPVFFIY